MADRETLSKYLRKVTGELRSAQRRVRELEDREREPIAIVGIACRYPGGVDSPTDLWRLLSDGGDGISPFPTDRGWDLERLHDPDPDRVGTSHTREGGFLAAIDRFDADFFGISPREAIAMDPQQRTLLETAWETVEDARIDPGALRGSRTGAFIGLSSTDYAQNVRLDAELEAYIGIGMTPSVASGRLAYALGLEGPAVTVDTACSSSLVALHLACQALRGGECSLALAGGATIRATPKMFAEFSRQRGLAPDGRCKSFAEAADGTAWSEGVGLLLVERLADAQSNGHPIWAVIRGSAINQDGASNGLTAPNGPSQERVIRAALANAGLEPGDVDAVEAHGTGTSLGDPIEAQALFATYGQGRQKPLRLGSIKSNIGHAQAAAGVAGVIKMALAMREGVLPKTLHVDEPSSKVEWETGGVELLIEAQPWERGERLRRAAVSSFGISGTNAHVILEEAPALSPAGVYAGDNGPGGGASSEALSRSPLPLALSAKSEPALRETAARLVSHLERQPQLGLTDVAHSLVATRALFEQRAVAIGAGRDELIDALGEIARGGSSARVIRARARKGKLALLFTGQGSQRAGMGRQLYEAYPAYADALDRVLAEFDRHLEQPLVEQLFADPGSEPAALLDHTANAQPALFATEVALYRLLQSWGLRPGLLAGHSIGEVVAAHVAGVFSLEDACRLVAARGRLMGELPGDGAMVAIEATEGEVEAALVGAEAELSLAAVNAPTAVVVSGEEEGVARVEAEFEARGHKTKRLAVSHAFHSPLIEPMLEPFAAVASGLSYREPQIPIVSTVSGELLSPAEATDPGYWVTQARQPVRFCDAVATLAERGAAAYLELGPEAVLSAMAAACLEQRPDQAPSQALIATLREDRPEPEALVAALAGAHAAAAAVEWDDYLAGAVEVPLPTYPFQRERYWFDSAAGAEDLAAVGQAPAEHPLLGASIALASGEEWLFTGRLSLQAQPWLAEHVVFGAAVVPGTAFVELALRAGLEVGAETVEELTLQRPLALPEQGAVQIQVTVGGPAEGGRREISIHSRPVSGEGEEGEAWACNASGVLAPRAKEPQSSQSWPPEGAEPIAVDDLYRGFAAAGYSHGPIFQGLTAAWRRGEEVFTEVSLPPEQRDQASLFGLHPALLDAALHGIELSPAKHPTGEGEVAVPFSWRDVTLHAGGAAELRVRVAPAEPEGASLQLADSGGGAVATVGALVVRPISLDQLSAAEQRREGLFEVEWKEVEAGERQAEPGEVQIWRSEVSAQADDPSEASRLAAEGALAAIQSWLGSEQPDGSRLALITGGAVAVGKGEEAGLSQAPVWGLVRSAQSEHPGRFVLIDSDGSEASEQALPGLLASEEPQLAIREGIALAPRLARCAVSESQQPPPEASFEPERTTLITGGSGGLGAPIARHLVEAHGARHLLLASRRGEAAKGAEELRAELEEMGAEVTFAACDVADRGQLEALLAALPKEHPLGAVVHAAGALSDGLIESLDAGQIEPVFAPKAAAAWHLHELTEELDLSAFVLFSSAVATLGNPGQANYAAANSFLDALAAHRSARGLPATAIGWGLWGEVGGMALRLSAADRARLERGGFDTLTAAEGLRLFDAALAVDRPQVLALRPKPAALNRLAAAAALPAILQGLVRLPAGRRRTVAVGALAEMLAATPEPERAATVLDLVRTEVAIVLGHSSGAAVDPERAFKELGFDSLAAVELRNRLSALTGMRLPATVTFDHPSSVALAAHLLADAEATGGGAQTARAPARVEEEPIAIVGIACRYPGGVGSPDELWQLLAEGRDGVVGFPADRGWDLERLYDPDPDHPGTSYTREGGFLADAAEFDPEFFGISPREALAMDPQQRLLLEASWEALEDAGIEPRSLRGSEAGVFAGVMNPDYGSRQRIPEEVEGYYGTGIAGSVASGRVSYALGLEGPAITVDTACSSSLVAMHLAAQALRGGECSLALAGGVSVLSTTAMFTEFSRQRVLAPDGRCKSFAEAADGVGWSEGAGVLVLERLSAAERNGHPVHAVIRGSAVNQDGASNGLTAPNGPSQERVIRQALANARLTPGDIDAVEAHGTGTTLGDPIEAGALLATYGREREQGRPLKLGSIKSNIGHTQAAAGVAGVIKTVMAMREGVLPKTLHVDAPSSKVDWEAGEIELLTAAEPWESNGRPRRAAVSSFGVSGTNAHLILEEAPESAPARVREAGDIGPDQGASSEALPGQIVMPISARTEPALREAAARLASHLDDRPELALLDVSHSLATARTHFEHRAVAVGEERGELVESLRRFAGGADAPSLISATAHASQPPVFLFPGQGAQHAQMALALLEHSPSFATHIERCEEALSPHVDWSLGEVLREEQGAWLERLDVVQPALFATMVSLARLWEELGVRPGVVLGHSQGEIAAAHIAGGLSLQDATLVVSRRAQAMAKIAGRGAMLSVSVPAAEIAPLLEPYGERLSLAAINGPASLALSGEPEALAELAGALAADGVRTREIAVDYAAHSTQIEDLEEELLEAFAPISPQSGEVPFHSTVSGEPIDTAELDAAYWYRNLRRTVLLEPVLRALLEQGQRTVIEIGPHPVLAFAVNETIEQSLDDLTQASVLGTLRREEGGPRRFCLSLAEAHANGAEVDWEAHFAGSGAKRVPLPTYPFQRQRYWLKNSAGGGDPTSSGQLPADHPLLGAIVEDPRGEGLTLTGRISLASHPWIADHALAGTVLLPGTALLEMALRAGAQVGAETLAELTLQAPLVIPEQGSIALQVVLEAPDEAGERGVSIHSRPDSGDAEGAEEAEWTCHAQGVLSSASAEAAEPIGEWPPVGAEPLAVDDLYERLAGAGFEYGPAFQGLTAAWQDGDALYAEVDLDESEAAEAGRFGLHPILLDAALHAALAASEDLEEPRLPFSWSDVALYARGVTRLRAVLRQTENGTSLDLYDRENGLVGRVGALVARPIDPGALAGARRFQGLYRVRWTQVTPPAHLGAGASGVELMRVAPAAGANPAEAARSSAGRVLEAMQGWLAAEHPATARLAILTKGAVSVSSGESPDLALAPLWGLVRSAQSEHPGCFALIDGDESEASEAAIPVALSSEEPQLALRDGLLLAPRIVPAEEGEDALLAPPGSWRLAAGRRGTLEELAMVSDTSAGAPLGPSEVRLAMHAAGLNFRDVMVALGFEVPGQGRIGSEGAGVVVEVGAEVKDLTVGDRVLGTVPDAFAPEAIAEAGMLAPVPPDWSFEQAASVSTAFLTARYGLDDLADLRKGERVLIHAGAGGVGMAAIQIARHLGAEVFATASPAKWEALEALGVSTTNIASSRDLDFKAKFLAETGGEGMDVVLNSLAGEFVDASLDLLGDGGRFLEMGKTDIRQPEQVERAHPGVSYQAYNLPDADSERLGEMLRETLDLFEQGVLKPLPISTWDVRKAPEAFRYLRQGQNVGKVVLTIPRPFDPGRTVLITGATGVLGAMVARRLVREHGARHLLLAARRGAAAEGAKGLKEELEELGATVEFAACDVSDRAQVEALLEKIPDERQLGAVIHAAGTIEDATIDSLGPAQLASVFAAKVDGAWHLHELTAGRDLSAFLMFSSATGTFGGPGQANYAAASVFLDALAARRQAEGLPATSVAWGLWAQQSAMTEHLGEADLARMERSGVGALSSAEGLGLFDAALASAHDLVLALRLLPAGLRAQVSAGTLPAILSGLTPGAGRSRSRPSASLQDQLARLPAAQHEQAVLELVRSEVARVLGHASPASIDGRRDFKSLGFDSLAAVELRNRLGAVVGMRLPSTLVFDHPTSLELAAYLLAKAGSGDSGEGGRPSGALVLELDRLETMLAGVESAEERERTAARLRELLAGLSGDEDDIAADATDEEIFELLDQKLGRL